MKVWRRFLFQGLGSSPSIIQNLPQVMSPNLVAGSASNAMPSGSGVEADAGVQAILQQWQEVKTEHGTMERTYTQLARAWPLASNVKLEGMESAILVLRQACEYLHDGMTRLSSITDQKRDTEKVQQAISEVKTVLQQLQTCAVKDLDGLRRLPLEWTNSQGDGEYSKST